MRATSRKNLLVGVAALAASVLLLTTFVVSTRAGLKTHLSPPDLTALRFLAAAVLLLPVFLKHGLMGLTWFQAVQLAIFGGAGFALTAYSGIQLAPVGHGSALIHGTLPLTTLVLHSAIHRVAPKAGQLFAVALILGGVALLVRDTVNLASGRELLGEGLLLGASMLWSAYGLTASRLKIPPFRGAAMISVISCALYLPVYLALGLGSLGDADVKDILIQTFIQGVLVAVVGAIVYIRAVATLGPSLVAATLAITPVSAVVAAWILLNEQPSTTAIIGVLVITAGVVGASIVSHRLASR